MKISTLLLIPTILLIACGSQKQVVKTNTAPQEEKVAQKQAPRWFDPNTLEEKDIEISARQKSEKIDLPDAMKTKEPLESETQKEANRIVDGFRIQLQASKSSEKMEKALKIAKNYFNPRGYEVYLVYESPLYKLRVGDATTRKHAEKILEISRATGYRDSWIVPDMVNGALDQAED